MSESYLSGHKNIFEKEKYGRIERATKLLNYKNKMSVEKQNLDFERKMRIDTQVTLVKRNFIN
jgi:hypothetical protein